MSRNGGFLVRDRDTGYLRDPKVIAAVRLAGLGAPILYDAVVDASWHAGRRVSALEALEALPRAYAAIGEEVAEALEAAGLLDSEGRVPEHVWADWYEGAMARKDRLTRAGKAGAEARWGGNATAMRPHYGDDGPRPSVRPSVRHPARDPQRGGNHHVELGPDGQEVLVPADGVVLPMVSFRDAMAAAGFAGISEGRKVDDGGT
jgi:hypothetical protein